MRYIYLLIPILFANAAFAGTDGHGGDPLEIEAVEYPDSTGLAKAIGTIKAQLLISQYPDAFKQRILAEIESLRIEKKYLLVESLMVVREVTGAEGIALPKDLKTFKSLGALTGDHSGDPIYFSSRVLRYVDAKLAELILHEVAHHLVTPALSEDEEFIVAFAASVTKGTYDVAIDKAIRTGIYVRNGIIPGKQFAEFMGKTAIKRLMYDFHHNKQYASVEDFYSCSMSNLIKNIPENVHALSLRKLSYIVDKAACQVHVPVWWWVFQETFLALGVPQEKISRVFFFKTTFGRFGNYIINTNDTVGTLIEE
jgi:hypothetical protein